MATNKDAIAYVQANIKRSPQGKGWVMEMPKLQNYPGHTVPWDVAGRPMGGQVSEAAGAACVAQLLAEIFFEFNLEVSKRERDDWRDYNPIPMDAFPQG